MIEAERSAAPDHDWNSRITRECYGRQGAAEAWLFEGARAAPSPAERDAPAGLARMINLYAWCSFDVGATLCEWFDAEAPEVMQAMIEGDRASIRRWGNGNAVAAPYHHVILPLASERDRRTEIRWGIKDFTRRFGRAPEGFWFPECAVDNESLEAVAAEGMRFTILAPYQVHGIDGSGLPVRWRGKSGREIIIVPYDGALAGDVAFGGLLNDARALSHRLTPWEGRELDGPRCTTMATDGETFGHHHHGGEATLAEAMSMLSRRTSSALTNTAALVATHDPVADITLESPSSWSCEHGVERWRSNCGCRVDTSRPPAQQWRAPLRAAMNSLAERCRAVFESEGRELFRTDPWEVRDAYGNVVAFDGDAISGFVNAMVRADANASERQRARELLELSRASLRTFTSCAWFFDDVDRIEVRQALRYAARCIELSGVAARLTPEYVDALGTASSNAPGAVSAAEVFVRDAMPRHDPMLRAAASFLALHLAGQADTTLGAYEVLFTESASGASHMKVSHRRSGRSASFVGEAHGEGPATVLSLAIESSGSDSVTPVTPVTRVHLSELPDVVARKFLLGGATQDGAMLGEPVN